MQRQALIDLICNTAPVASIKAAEIAAHFEEKELGKGEYLLKEGRVSNEYLFLTEGFMRSFAYDVEGNDITTWFCTTGQVVFEVSSFFTRTPSKENIVAITDCKGLTITYDKLNELFHGLPEFREFGRATLVRGFAALKERMLATITETAEERYSTLLATQPELLQYAPLKTIASYLGITDTSLSRIRKELAHK